MARLSLLMILYFVLHHYRGKAAGTLLDRLTPYDDPDAKRNVSELIMSKGYPVEEHTVQTEDGYLLSVQRIPFGRNGNAEIGGKEVVLLIHGLTGDATNWVLNFPNQSLGFILPDSGYDVWLLNTRGCIYSKKHVTYTTHQYEFWNFSFSEVGRYDIPATIDYILEETGEEDLFVVGHSQGTTATFAMLSEMPEYNEKVKLFLALAPVATVGYITSVIRVLVPLKDAAELAIDALTAGEFLPNDEVMNFLREQFCGMLSPESCEYVIFAVGGEDRTQLNKTRLGVYAAHIPSETSIKSFVHYGQMVESKKFCHYDYRARNLQYYNQEKPPEYNVSAITADVALFWSPDDALADTEDVDLLRKSLNSLVYDYQVPSPFNHFDFILALNAFELLHEHILQLLSL